MKEFFTTGDVARICDIAPKTVINYCESGKISSEKSPVTNYRRIPRRELLRFMTKHNVPIGRLEEMESWSILIVDDDPGFVQVVKKALRSSGRNLSLAAAYDGYEALVEIGKRRPDVVILDVRMPKLDGYEVCRALRTDPELRDLKICAISGVPEEGIKQRILQVGADMFVDKPLELRAFVPMILDLLQVPRPRKGRGASQAQA